MKTHQTDKKMMKAMLKQSLLSGEQNDFQAEGGGAINASNLASLAGSNLLKSRVEDDASTHIEGFKEFEKYGELFQDLTTRSYIPTGKDIINIIITYDSKHAVAIMSNKPEVFAVKGYDLNTQDEVFCKDFEGEYLKMNVIEQTDDGTIFGVAYQNNGHFSVLFIDNKGTIIDDLDVSKLLQLDDESKPISGFFEPLITVSFLPNDKAIIAVYHRIQKK